MGVVHLTDIEQLMEQVVAYYPEADTSLIRRAYEYSVKAHEGQMCSGNVALGGAATPEERTAMGGQTVFPDVRLSVLGIRLYTHHRPTRNPGVGETDRCGRHPNPTAREGQSRGQSL